MVRQKLISSLPDHFGLLLDQWFHNGQYFYSIYVAGHGIPNNGCTFLGVLEKVGDCCTEIELYAFISQKLELLDSGTSSVIYLVAEECDMISDLAEILGCFLIDCFYCRIDKAALSFVNELEVDDYKHRDVIAKAIDVISFLQRNRDLAEILPIANKVASIFIPNKWDNNWKRFCYITNLYVQISEDIYDISNGNNFVGEHLKPMVLNEAELELLHKINKALGDAYFISDHLEKEHVDLADATFVKSKIQNSHGVHFSFACSEFEIAVAKQIDEESLTEVEENILAPFQEQQKDAEYVRSRSHALEQLMKFRDRKAAKKKYIGLEDIPCSIAQVRKRFTENCKIRTATKSRMNASIFEDVMFWFVNKDLITPFDVHLAMRNKWVFDRIKAFKREDWNQDFEEMEP